MGRHASRSVGMRLLSENLFTRQNESTRLKSSIAERITLICAFSRGTPAITCLLPSCTFDRYSRSFRREKHKPSQSNSIWTCQRNGFSIRKTANWTKWWHFVSTKTTTIISISQVSSSPHRSVPVWRRWCVVSSQVENIVFLLLSSLQRDGRRHLGAATARSSRAVDDGGFAVPTGTHRRRTLARCLR